MQSLPDYMAPAATVILDRFPLTPNGKIDRAALPPAVAVPRSSEPPRNSQERELAEIWQELLGVHEIGINDNFFELGGHSLLATQFAARVADRLGVELPLRTIFVHPTIGELAVAILESQAKQIDSKVVP